MIKIRKSFVDGSTILGVALSLFGIGTIVPGLWEKLVMFSCCFIYLVFSIITFGQKERK